MTAHRAGWFEAFESYVQFYPKLSVAIAFGAMATAARMIPRRVNGVAPARVEVESAPTILSAARKTPKKSAVSRKGPSARKTSKARRKAA